MYACIKKIIMIATTHLGCSRTAGLSSTSQGWLLIVLGIALFPLVPTFYNIYLLVCPKSTTEEKAAYTEHEHEIKFMAGAVEGPVQLIMLIYLMYRGILTLYSYISIFRSLPILEVVCLLGSPDTSLKESRRTITFPERSLG